LLMAPTERYSMRPGAAKRFRQKQCSAETKEINPGRD
jgi:hypothetical protein